jgi:hypothetical protein
MRRDWFTVPAGETDEEHITPAQFLAYRRQRLGIPPERQDIQPIAFLTLLQQIAEQFAQETHACPAGRASRRRRSHRCGWGRSPRRGCVRAADMCRRRARSLPSWRHSRSSRS